MRLIDADILIEKLKSYAECDWNKSLCTMLPNVVDDCIEFVDEQTTAYDIDKVVEELEEIANPKELYFCRVSKGRCIHDEDDIGCIDCLAQKAIEIVKHGYLDDDV